MILKIISYRFEKDLGRVDQTIEMIFAHTPPRLQRRGNS